MSHCGTRMVGSCGDGIALTLASSRTILDPLCRWETLSTVHLSQQCPRFSSRAPHLPRRPRENLPTKCFHPSQGITVEVSPHTTTLCLRGKVVVFARCPQAQSCPQALAAQACQERSVKAFFGSDRSPRCHNVVCACVCPSPYSKEH